MPARKRSDSPFLLGVTVGRLTLFVSAFLSVLTSFANADSARECVAPSRVTFDRHWAATVEPHFASGKRLVFAGKRNIPIVYRAWVTPGATRSIVLFTGYAENVPKYKEVIANFACLGYSVYAMNWTGMGESGRSLRVSGRQVVHIDDFKDYVDDAEKFVSLVRENDKNPLFLFAHSTGGLLASHLLARRDSWFRAAVFNAPLFELDLGKWPYYVALNLLKAQVAIGRGGHYAPGFSDFDPAAARFADNIGTRSPERWTKYRDLLLKDRSLLMGGPSAQWVLTILRETTNAKVEALARRQTVPVLIYQAGADRYVRPGGQNRFCSAHRDCRLRFFPGAFHEIYRELDAARVPVMLEADAFYRAH